MRFVRIEDKDGLAYFVNPALVRFVIAFKGGCRVVFGEADWIECVSHRAPQLAQQLCGESVEHDDFAEHDLAKANDGKGSGQ